MLQGLNLLKKKKKKNPEFPQNYPFPPKKSITFYYKQLSTLL